MHGRWASIAFGSAVRQRIGVVTSVVRDYDEAIAYFTQKLGFALAQDTPVGAGKRWVVVAPRGRAAADEPPEAGRRSAGRRQGSLVPLHGGLPAGPCRVDGAGRHFRCRAAGRAVRNRSRLHRPLSQPLRSDRVEHGRRAPLNECQVGASGQARMLRNLLRARRCTTGSRRDTRRQRQDRAGSSCRRSATASPGAAPRRASPRCAAAG